MLPYRLAAIVLFLGLLSGASAATPEPYESIVLSELKVEEKQINFNYNPTDLKEIEHVKEMIWMQKEILHLWKIYLNGHGFIINQTRLKELKKLAWHLTIAIDKNQRTPANWKWWIPGRKGLTLPKNADAHLLLATMAGFESKVNPTLVGKLGEVGILQCHKWCRKGHSKKEVRKNPQLGIELAVKFLAESIDQCGIELDSLSNEKIRDREWSKPIALYGAGNSVFDGRHCGTRNFARQRVNKMKKLRKKIRD